MNVVARAIAPSCVLPKDESDIFLFKRSGTTLELGVQANSDRDAATIVITFDRYYTIFLTDEGDLPRYWQSGQFKNGGHLFEVLDGGLLWNESQVPGLLVVTSALQAREWFVCSSGQCITVLSDIEPSIRVVEGVVAF